MFGSPNNWRGLGVFFDSFDNDNKVYYRNLKFHCCVNSSHKIYNVLKDCHLNTQRTADLTVDDVII